MGTIYLAEQTDANRLVALKLLHTDLISSEEDRQRFVQEFKMLSKLSDEHIVSFYTASISDEGIPYAACEYLEGQSLKLVINIEGRLSFARTLNIINQIANAMSIAHAQNIVHRDLKPENIMLVEKPEKDWVKVLDFGLSKFSNTEDASAHQKLTQTGALVGTVNYMSPEQCLGRVLDQRSDIYSLGCIAFECLSGEPLFQADTPLGVLHKHLNEDAEHSLRKRQLNCPGQFIPLLQKSLKKSPEERFQSMDELIAELSDKALLAESIPTNKRMQRSLVIAASLLLSITIPIIISSFIVQSKKQKSNIDPTLLTTTNKAKRLFVEGKQSKAYELVNQWLKQHEAANDITLAEAWYQVGQFCPDDKKKTSWFTKSKGYFKKHFGDSELARSRMIEIIPALINLHMQQSSIDGVEQELKDAMVCFGKNSGLTEFHPEMARLITRSSHRKQFISPVKSYVDSLAISNESVSELIKLSMQLGDCLALEDKAEDAERYYRKSMQLIDHMRMKEQSKADVAQAHLLRRLVLLHPEEETARDNFINSLKGKRADNWAVWYILWGSADEQEDFGRAFPYAHFLLAAAEKPPGNIHGIRAGKIMYLLYEAKQPSGQ